jgi:7-carboxy-7-deazaguanine synthase
MNDTADIIEIFSSVQGEGPFIGQRHIFIRFKDCNLDCFFCDTDREAGYETLDIAGTIRQIEYLNIHSTHNTVALTGGEPLLYSGFLKSLIPEVRDMGLKVYLQTNGTLADRLDDVISYVDIISVDIKLPSVSRNRPCWQAHRSFLEKAFEKEFFVKVVVSDKIDMAEFDKALALVKGMSLEIPFVIQPETEKGSCRINISADMLLSLQERALKVLNNVLVIPQAHKMMGLR